SQKRRERLVQLMCDRGGHFRHAQISGIAGETFLGNEQVLLGLFLIFDIDMNTVPALNGPIFIELWVGADDKPAKGSIRTANASLAFKFHFGAERIFPTAPHNQPVFGVEDVIKSSANKVT